MENFEEVEKINDILSVQIDEEVPYTMIENYIMDIEGLSANKKLFFIMLRRYAGHGVKPAFPSYSKLKKATGIKSDDTIVKNINFFIWIKFMDKITRQKNNSKEKDTNYYVISLKRINVVLEHFKKNNIKFDDVEKYFDDEYNNKETTAADRKIRREKLLNTINPFFKD